MSPQLFSLNVACCTVTTSSECVCEILFAGDCRCFTCVPWAKENAKEQHWDEGYDRCRIGLVWVWRRPFGAEGVAGGGVCAHVDRYAAKAACPPAACHPPREDTHVHVGCGGRGDIPKPKSNFRGSKMVKSPGSESSPGSGTDHNDRDTFRSVLYCRSSLLT